MSNTPTLIAKPSTVQEIDYKELEQFLTEAFGRSYTLKDFSPEWTNDTWHKLTITGDIDDYDREEVEDFISGTHQYGVSVGTALEYLCAVGNGVKPGVYLIDVSW